MIEEMLKEVLKKVVYKERFVAFLDILGYEDLIHQNELLSTITINHLERVIEDVKSQLHPEGADKLFSTKLFSDCFCISCDYCEDNIWTMLFALANIQFQLATEGISLRGGLATGLHYESDNIIFSQGLIKAYKLEKNATNPRIIIDDALLGMIKKHQSCNRFIKKAPDGYYFIDYIESIFSFTLKEEWIYSALLKHKKETMRQIFLNINKIEVVEKYRWVVEYHNYKITKKLPQFIMDKTASLLGKPSNEYGESLIIPESIFPKFEDG